MTKETFQDALDDVIEKFNNDAGVAINYCPSDEISTPLAQTHEAMTNCFKIYPGHPCC